MDKFSGSLVSQNFNTDYSQTVSQQSSTSVTDFLVAKDPDSPENTILLRASLHSSSGEVLWLPHPSKDAAECEVVTRSQMKSMLQDSRRNDVFASAISSRISSFKAKHGGIAPKVLDIGSGTGLLSLLAANAGAASPVVACEQWSKMAQIASSVISTSSSSSSSSPSNLIQSGAIQIKAIHSSTLEAPIDAESKFDMIVHEILDSSLFGEGVIPALRDAYARLCKPDAESIPHSAILRARLIWSDDVRKWHDTSETFVRRQPDVLYARRDWASKCEAVVPAIPVHAFQLSSMRHVSKEFIAATVDFSRESIESNTPEKGYDISSLQVEAEAGIDAKGSANAVLFYWDLYTSPSGDVGGGGSLVYSTSPDVMKTHWQDHWTQCIYPLSSPVSPSISSVNNAYAFTVATCRTDSSIAFFSGPAECAVFPSKRSRSLLVKSPNKSAADSKRETMPALIAEPQPCSCGLHTICSHERRWMLASESRMSQLSTAVDQVLHSASSKKLDEVKQAALDAGIDDDEDGGGRDTDLRVLGLGDGSVTGLLSATTKALPGIRIVAFSLESSGQPSAVHAAACAAAVGASDRLAVLTHAAFEASPDVLGAAEAEMLEEEGGGDEDAVEEEGGEGNDVGEERDFDQEEDYSGEAIEGAGMGVDGFAIAFASDALAGVGVGDAGSNDNDDDEPVDMEAAENAALVHGTRSAQAEVLLCEPYFSQLSTAPPSWTLAAVWMRRSVLQRIGSLTTQARVLPHCGIIYAQSVRFKNLHKTFGTLTKDEFPCKFDHSSFNQEVEKAPLSSLTFAFPLWQYEYEEVSPPAVILRVDIEASLSPLPDEPWVDSSGKEETRPKTSPIGSPFRCGSSSPVSLLPNKDANAVIFWVDYHLDKEGKFILSTHSKAAPFSRQGVRFCKGMKASSWFDEERGNFELWAE
jgi:predicted RNA methylase